MKYIQIIHSSLSNQLLWVVIMIATIPMVGCNTIPTKAVDSSSTPSHPVIQSAAPDLQSQIKNIENLEYYLAERQDKLAGEFAERIADLAERKTELASLLAEQKMAEKEQEFLDHQKISAPVSRQQPMQNNTINNAKMVYQPTLSENSTTINPSTLSNQTVSLSSESSDNYFANWQTQQTAKGLVLTLDDVLFATDKADLKPDAMRQLEQLAEFLNQYSTHQVLIEGYTDNNGSTKHNKQLSKRRANAVRNYLLDSGIQPERMISKGYGENYPRANNQTAAGRQQNRRVEIIILNEAANSLN